MATNPVLASTGCWLALPDSGQQSGIQVRALQQSQEDIQTVTSLSLAPAQARRVRSCRTALV